MTGEPAVKQFLVRIFNDKNYCGCGAGAKPSEARQTFWPCSVVHSRYWWADSSCCLRILKHIQCLETWATHENVHSLNTFTNKRRSIDDRCTHANQGHFPFTTGGRSSMLSQGKLEPQISRNTVWLQSVIQGQLLEEQSLRLMIGRQDRCKNKNEFGFKLVGASHGTKHKLRQASLKLTSSECWVGWAQTCWTRNTKPKLASASAQLKSQEGSVVWPLSCPLCSRPMKLLYLERSHSFCSQSQQHVNRIYRVCVLIAAWRMLHLLYKPFRGLLNIASYQSNNKNNTMPYE